MKIHVHLYMSLEKMKGNNEFMLELEDKDAVINSLFKKLSVSEKAVGLVSINGQVIRNKKTILKDGDKVKLFPIVAGG